MIFQSMGLIEDRALAVNHNPTLKCHFIGAVIFEPISKRVSFSFFKKPFHVSMPKIMTSIRVLIGYLEIEC